MGATIAVVFTKNYPSLSVDDRRKGFKHTIGFSPVMFPRYEWTVMKSFCNKYRIRQKHLVFTFHRFLRHEEVYLRNFRIRTDDIKRAFLHKSRVMREMADVVIPLLFMKPFVGLDASPNAQEVSFTRFVVTSYLFCNQPHIDLVADFIALTKQKFKLASDSLLHFYSLSQLVTLLMEDLEHNAARGVLLNCLNAQSQFPDIKIKTVVNLACKYPLMLYALERFRRHFRRLVFGDRFWRNRKILTPRIKGADTFNVNMRNKLRDELSARRMTCIALIGDAVAQHKQLEAEKAKLEAREAIMAQYRGKTLAQFKSDKQLQQQREEKRLSGKEKRLRFGANSSQEFEESVIGSLSGPATIYGLNPTDTTTAAVSTAATTIATTTTTTQSEQQQLPVIDSGSMTLLKPKNIRTGANTLQRMFVLCDAVTDLVQIITEEVEQILKDTFGFEFSRQLIIHSEIPLDHESPQLQKAFAGKLKDLEKHEPLIEERKHMNTDANDDDDGDDGNSSDSSSNSNGDNGGDSDSDYGTWGRSDMNNKSKFGEDTSITAAAREGSTTAAEKLLEEEQGATTAATVEQQPRPQQNRLKLQLSRVASMLRKEEIERQTNADEDHNNSSNNDIIDSNDGVKKRFDAVLLQLSRNTSMSMLRMSRKFLSTDDNDATTTSAVAAAAVGNKQKKKSTAAAAAAVVDSDDDSAHEADSEQDDNDNIDNFDKQLITDGDGNTSTAERGVLFVKSRDFLVGSQKSTRTNTTPFTEQSNQFFDSETNRSFRYDTESGKVSWAKVVVSSKGRVLRESFD